VVSDDRSGSHEDTSQAAQTARARAERAARNDERKAERARQVREAEAQWREAQQRAAAEQAADDASVDGGDEGDANAHATEAAIAARRIAELEQRLQAAEARVQVPQPPQQLASPTPSQVHSPPPIHWAAAAPRADGPQVRMDAVRVEELRCATAPTQLPDWIFSMEKLIEQLEAAAPGSITGSFQGLFACVRRNWDRSMQKWWDGRQRSVLEGASAAVSSWADLVAALNADFALAMDEDKALTEWDQATQRSGESMEAYVGRLAMVHARIDPTRVASHTFAEKVLRGVDRKRFPHAFMEVSAKQRSHILANKKGFSFEVLRGLLTQAAVPETAEHEMRGQQRQSGPAADGTPSRTSADTKSRAKLNTVRARAAAAAASDDDQNTHDEHTRSGASSGSVIAEMRAQINALTRALAASSSSSKTTHSGRAGQASEREAATAAGERGRERSRSRGDGRAGGQTRGGRCTKCGVKGHGRVDCKSNKEVGCFGCGGDHLRRDCPGEEAEGQTASGN